MFTLFVGLWVDLEREGERARRFLLRVAAEDEAHTTLRPVKRQTYLAQIFVSSVLRRLWLVGRRDADPTITCLHDVATMVLPLNWSSPFTMWAIVDSPGM